jgi:hypothetical protein
MKRVENLQENLKNLPKYTLNEEQKERVSLALKRRTKYRKRVQVVKPITAFALLCATVFVLVLSSDGESNNWFNQLKQSFQPQIELSAQEAEVFKLPSYNQEVFGVEGKLGILGASESFVAEDARRGSKLMMYFWGDSSKLIDKNYRVEALNSYNNKIILSEGVLTSPLYSEDAHTLTRFTPFPTEGKWQLSFFIEDQLFEEFTMEVLPPFPKTEHYTLINHPMELKVGEETEIYIESPAESGKKIEVKLINKKGSIVSEQIFIQDGTFIAGSGGYIYHYSGNIKFPERDTWKLLINGEKTKSFKN